MNEFEVVEDIVAEPEEPTWVSAVANGFTLFQANAWYIAAIAALLYLLWTEKLSSKYYKWKENQKSQSVAAEMKKDPDQYIYQEEARMSAIQRLQAEYNVQASKMNEINKEKERKKKEELASKMKVDSGRKLNDDYFPLAGGGSSLGYRARRPVCPGGSCNNR